MNILIVRTDKLGDFITTLPAIKVLKNYNPLNKIIVCVAPLNKELASTCSFIDEVVVDDNSNIFNFANKLRNLHVDCSITMFSNTRVAFAQFLAGIKLRIAPATKIAQIFYTKRVKQKRSQVKMSEFEYNLQLTKELFKDIDLNYKKPVLEFKDSKIIYEKFCKEFNIEKKVVAFHVGFGGSSDANWTKDEYVLLIKEVLKKNNYQIVLTFGPDEKELYKEMQEKLKDLNITFFISTNGLVEFAKLISGFEYFISTSTGTYHLASAVGVKTITFFGDSLFASAKRWKSVGDENLQQHFMIPKDTIKREKLFSNILKILEKI